MAGRLALGSLVEAGDLAGLRAALSRADKKALNTPDHRGHTLLMRAVLSARATNEMVRVLLAHGASITQSAEDDKPDALRLALSAGDPEKVATLLDAGANPDYRTAKGYDALIDAVHGRDIPNDTRLLELLALLIDAKVALDGASSYGETAVRVLSRRGRFDAVALLLAAGSDRNGLKWSALHDAVALGTFSDVEACAREGAALEDIDDCARTPWMLAVVAGDADKARLLQDLGADVFACGLNGETAVHMAAGSARQIGLLRWLLEQGRDANSKDSFGRTPLMAAIEANADEAVALLLAKGADVDQEYNGTTALSGASTAAIVVRLLEAGADPQRMSAQGRRALVGLAPDSDPGALASISEAEFIRTCTRRFGLHNPEEFDEPFLRAMVQSGADAFRARKAFPGAGDIEAPVWCAARFGQSITALPDGRVVQIGGEHEDFYDPDFCIYNDVFIHDRAGGLQILGYPRSVFPPTDFHTATLVGDYIYVIGALGYTDARRHATTPVYRFSVRDWRVETVDATGVAPGWIHRHRARLVSPTEIEVTGGELWNGPRERALNARVFVLDVGRLVWRVSDQSAGP